MMRLSLSSSGLIFLVVVALLLAPLSSEASTEISFGSEGLESLKHDGVEYLRLGGCAAQAIGFEHAAGGVGRSQVQIGNDSVTRRYPWGSLRCNYSVSGDRVNIDVSVSNTTPNDIRRLTIQLITLAMPMPANGSHLTNTKRNLEGPDILALYRGDTTLLIANLQVAKVLDLRGQQAPGGVSIVLDTVLQAPLPTARLVGGESTAPEARPRHVEVARSIPARNTDRYSIAVCFLREGESPRALLGDLFERVTARFPATLKWPDRRPIGFLALASHGRQTPFNPLNPRYWRIVKPSVDVTSPAGRAEFQTWLLGEADRTVAILKQMNAQGVIVWDIEGQQYRQPVSYVGDPHQLAPEMQGVVDRFFKRFTDAGLRCGVTIRPQRFVVLGDGQASQENSDDSENVLKLLDDKIQYAQKRWGCTLFYIDSTGDPNWPIDASIFRTLAADHLDVLLCPENKTIVDFAWTAPFWGVTQEPPPSHEARWVYPRAFSVIEVSAGVGNPGDVRWQTLVQSVKAGDVLMFTSWVDVPNNQAVLRIYQEALGPNWREARH